MHNKIRLFPWWLALLVWGSTSWAETVEEYKINGKPVPEIVASVNGTNISRGFLQGQVQAWKMMSMRQGKEVTPEEEESFARSVVTTAIELELLYQRGKELNIEVSTETIQRELRNIQTKFPNTQIFLASLAFQNLTLNALIDKIDKQLTEDEIIRREIAPYVDVEDGTVEAFYNEHKESFIELEKYQVSQIFVEIIGPEEGQSEDPKDQEKANHIVEGINREARRTIDAALQKLKEGTDFAELARQVSEDDASKDNGGYMGEFYLNNAYPALALAIASMKVGDFSEVVKSGNGFHILKLNSKTPARQKPLAEVKSDILNVLLKIEVDKKRTEYVSKLKETADIKIFL